MIGFSSRTVLPFAFLLLTACGAPPAPPAGRTAAALPRSEVYRIVDAYWDAYLALNPLQATAAGEHQFDDRIGTPLSVEHLADSLALERRALHDLLAVPEASLDAETRLTYELFRRQRELAIEGFTYPAELLPVNPFDSLPQRFALWGSGGGAQPFATQKDYENWLARIEDYRRWTDQAIANMRAGVRRGYSLPRGLVERMLPQLEFLGEAADSNVFYQPLRALPQGIPESARPQLVRQFAAAVKTRLLPSYRELHDFLKSEYLPRARSGLALAELPLGEAWYAYLVRRSTATALTPAEIHSIGLAQVEGSRGRMQAFLAETAFPGNLAGYIAYLRSDPHGRYASGEDLLAAYRDLKNLAAQAVSASFALPAIADYEIRGVPRGCEAAFPAVFYQGAAPQTGRPAIVYVNSMNLPATPAYTLETRSLNAGVPGHHLQRAIQLARETRPRFRRFADFPGFSEGWGAYAASLGEELGFYKDPTMRFGELMAEMQSAAALVVDTGLHAKGWSRRQALDYLEAHAAMDETEAGAAVDRYSALPAAALAAGIGELKIRAIRQRAQQQLGAGFDARAFHSELLEGGALPLDMLEAKMARWMQAPP
jgi:uncharacterized protein (DUF885 family)